MYSLFWYCCFVWCVRIKWWWWWWIFILTTPYFYSCIAASRDSQCAWTQTGWNGVILLHILLALLLYMCIYICKYNWQIDFSLFRTFICESAGEIDRQVCKSFQRSGGIRRHLTARKGFALGRPITRGSAHRLYLTNNFWFRPYLRHTGATGDELFTQGCSKF